MMIASTSVRKPTVLVVDDDESYQLALRSLLKPSYQVRTAFNSDEAIAIVKNNHIDLVILDMQIRTSDEGLRAIPLILAVDDSVSIVISSGLTELKYVREAIQLGALDYISKESGPEELLHSIARVLDKRGLLKRNAQKDFEVKTAQKKNILIGNSPQIVTLRKFIDKIRVSRANSVIYGETGTGKEVVARMLRAELPDGSLAPFVAVDSATIHSETAESILFGHEKGAFTGADKPRKGVFEAADGGTIYFDELANMSLEIQAKLLRVIQEKEILRLGCSRSIPLDFRVIAATNKDIEALVKKGQFKEDLYQRLNVLPIFIPALRERVEDIAMLIEYFIGQFSNGERWLNFTETALIALQRYPWPGNVRELQNLISYLFAVSDLEEIDLQDLPAKFRDGDLLQKRESFVHAVSGASDQASTSFYDRVAQYEATILKEEFARAEGNVSRLAEKLGMDRSHLYSKLKAYGIHTAAPKAKTLDKSDGAQTQ